MTEYKNKFLNLILLILPFMFLYNNTYVIGRIKLDLIFKIILAFYFGYYLLFKTNSRFKKYTKILVLLGVFCFLYLSVELNVIKFKYIDSYIEYIFNFLLFPFTLISLLCIYNDSGFNKENVSKLLIYNLLIYSIFSFLKLGFINIYNKELCIMIILLYPIFLNNIKPKFLTIVIYSFIICGLSLITNVFMLVGIIILLLIGFLLNMKKKEYNSFLLITLLFLIVNFSFDKNVIIYKFSILNFVMMFSILIVFITTYIFNIKSKKTKISKETILLLFSLLIISYVLLFEKALLNNYYLTFYICLIIIYIAHDSRLFEKEPINNKKIVILAPISSRFNSQDDSIDFAKLLNKDLNVEIVFRKEKQTIHKFPKKSTVLYLSENNSIIIKNLYKKYIMYTNAKVLIALDNDIAKLINKYSRVETKKIMIKQGDYTSIDYGKFLSKKLKNIPTLIFTSKRALNIYSSVLSSKKCYYIDNINECLKKVLEEDDE